MITFRSTMSLICIFALCTWTSTCWYGMCSYFSAVTFYSMCSWHTVHWYPITHFTAGFILMCVAVHVLAQDQNTTRNEKCSGNSTKGLPLINQRKIKRRKKIMNGVTPCYHRFLTPFQALLLIHYQKITTAPNKINRPRPDPTLSTPHNATKETKFLMNRR